jgi:hypothetical protein
LGPNRDSPCHDFHHAQQYDESVAIFKAFILSRLTCFRGDLRIQLQVEAFVFTRRVLVVQLRFAFQLALLATFALSSCKSRCLGSESCSGEIRSTEKALEPVPWRPAMTPAELLKHSNEIYLGFLERYLGSEKGDFPVPEFKTVQVEMLGHLENLRSTAPDQPSPATRIRKPLARPTDEELKTDHLRTIWNRDLPQINEEAARFNSTLSKQCIQNRIEKWKELADPVETPKLTYRAFWRQHWVFAFLFS